MNINIKEIITAIILIISQLLIDQYVNLGQYITIAIFPIIILSLPIKTNTPKLLFISFILGFIIDILSNNIIGISSAALVFASLFRNSILSLILPEYNSESLKNPLSGNSKYIISSLLYILIFYALYSSAYVLIEGMGVTSILDNIIRITTYTLINAILAFFITLFAVNEH